MTGRKIGAQSEDSVPQVCRAGKYEGREGRAGSRGVTRWGGSEGRKGRVKPEKIEMLRGKKLGNWICLVKHQKEKNLVRDA